MAQSNFDARALVQQKALTPKLCTYKQFDVVVRTCNVVELLVVYSPVYRLQLLCLDAPAFAIVHPVARFVCVFF